MFAQVKYPPKSIIVAFVRFRVGTVTLTPVCELYIIFEQNNNHIHIMKSKWIVIVKHDLTGDKAWFPGRRSKELC